jgi:hypothetical protein
MTLIYAGIGYDSEFLDNDIFDTYNRIVAYDTLPFHAHYEHGQAGWKHTKTKKCFFRKLRNEFGTYEKVNGHLEFTLPNGGILEYHYSVNSHHVDIPHGDILIRGYFNDGAKWLDAYNDIERTIYLADDTCIPDELDEIDYIMIDFD